VLVHCSLLGGVAFEEAGLLVLSWLCQYCCSKKHITLAGLFFVILLFWLCASVISLGQCVVAEAGCNWYLRDINIYSLSKKRLVERKGTSGPAGGGTRETGLLPFSPL
jgi:hypothetical protein